MSLVVNTNVSSLTAQRALAYADSLQGEAMTRLSTGSKINSASDDAAGLAIAQRMTAQVKGLNMAIKNANDGISLTQSVEGALVEVSDMLQRMRELSVQAANDTNTGVDRKAIQEEISLLVAEISRVSSNTRFNDMKVLDGSMSNAQLQIGTQGGETIDLTIGSVNANVLGAYSLTGDRVEAFRGNGAGANNNQTDAADDFIISGGGVVKTVDVAAQEEAGSVASKINAVSGETGVTATAKTYALLYSDYGVERSMSVIINGKSTGQFLLSNSYTDDAIAKINAISGQTGVTATAYGDSKIRLYNSEGKDIVIENESTVKDAAGSNKSVLRVQTMNHDGVSVNNTKYFHRAAASVAAKLVENQAQIAEHGDRSAMGGLDNTTQASSFDPTMTLVRRSTGDKFTFQITQATDGHTTVAELKSALNGISGVDGFEVLAVDDAGDTTYRVTATEEFGDFDIYAGSDPEDATKKTTFEGIAGVQAFTGFQNMSNTGNFYLHNRTTGTSQLFTVTDSIATTNSTNKFDAEEITAALNGLQGFQGVFSVEGYNIADSDTVADSNDGTDVYHIHGPADFGDWFISTSADITAAALTGTADLVTGDINANDVHLEVNNTDNDTATVQGTIQLQSDSVFSVRSESEQASSGTLASGDTVAVTANGTANPAAQTLHNVATGSMLNDNYFTSQSAKLNTVGSVDLTSQTSASAAIAIIDGAISKVSSMRSSLGAVENRLEHTVSNLMNISEKTESSRSRIQDADFAAESAKLSKAQVLKQAGVGMLAQANATSQLVLQLLQ